MNSPLANHCPDIRWHADQLKHLLTTAVTPKAIAALEMESSEPTDVPKQLGLSSIAWAIKYDLLRPRLGVANVESRDPASCTANTRITNVTTPRFTLSATCMGRLDHLQQTLPHWVELPHCHIVLVDYSCPQNCGHWVREHFDTDQVTVVKVEGRQRFDRCEAKNTGILASTTDWVCLIDADIIPHPDFADEIISLLRPGRFLRSSSILEGTGGTFIAQREALLQVQMHDPVYQGWGEEDDDLLDALTFIGQEPDVYPDRLVEHIEHEDDLRTQFHEYADRRISHMVNRIYRAAKWDLARLMGKIPNLKTRQQFYEDIRTQLRTALQDSTSAKIVLDTGRMNWVPLAASCGRQMVYQVNMDDTVLPGEYAKRVVDELE